HHFMTIAQANAWHYWWLISSNPDNEGLMGVGDVPTKRMYVLGQFSRFVRPNFYRIGAYNNDTALISAYKATNATAFAIVAINTSNAPIDQIFNLLPFTAASVTPWITSSTMSLSNQTAVAVTNASFTYTLPAMSVVTFVGQGNTPPTIAPVANK